MTFRRSPPSILAQFPHLQCEMNITNMMPSNVVALTYLHCSFKNQIFWKGDWACFYRVHQFCFCMAGMLTQVSKSLTYSLSNSAMNKHLRKIMCPCHTYVASTEVLFLLQSAIQIPSAENLPFLQLLPRLTLQNPPQPPAL